MATIYEFPVDRTLRGWFETIVRSRIEDSDEKRREVKVSAAMDVYDRHFCGGVDTLTITIQQADGELFTDPQTKAIREAFHAATAAIIESRRRMGLEIMMLRFAIIDLESAKG